MTRGQQRAFDQNWARWGLDHQAGRLVGEQLFGRRAPLILEIGFGMGQSLLTMAAEQPDHDFIGIEVHKPGVGRLLYEMVQEDVQNIRVYCHDAVEVLCDCIADASLDKVQIFFPDPWHKKRHHKRRLIQPDFVALLASKLKVGGTLHLATDWENYAQQMLDVVTRADGFVNTCGEGNFSTRPDERPLTKFEQRGERLGHGVWDLIFERV